MLGVDEGRLAAALLGLGDDVEGQGGLAGGLGAVDLDDPPAREAADAQGQVEGDRAGRDGLDGHRRPLLAELHDRALAELLLDLGQRGVDGLVAGGLFFVGLGVLHGDSFAGRVFFHHVRSLLVDLFLGHLLPLALSEFTRIAPGFQLGHSRAIHRPRREIPGVFMP